MTTELAQVGVTGNVDVWGNVSYQTWYQLDPWSNISTNIGANCGEEMYGSIDQVKDSYGRYNLYYTLMNLSRNTSNGSDSINPGPVIDGTSAEWIVERPLSSGSLTCLPYFSPISFYHSAATMNGNSQYINNLPHEYATMWHQDWWGRLSAPRLAYPGATDSYGDFRIYFQNWC